MSDLVRGINLVMEGDFIEPINLGNPDEVTILQIAREVIELTGSKSRIDFMPMPPDDPGCGARTSPGPRSGSYL